MRHDRTREEDDRFSQITKLTLMITKLTLKDSLKLPSSLSGRRKILSNYEAYSRERASIYECVTTAQERRTTDFSNYVYVHVCCVREHANPLAPPPTHTHTHLHLPHYSFMHQSCRIPAKNRNSISAKGPWISRIHI